MAGVVAETVTADACRRDDSFAHLTRRRHTPQHLAKPRGPYRTGYDAGANYMLLC